MACSLKFKCLGNLVTKNPDEYEYPVDDYSYDTVVYLSKDTLDFIIIHSDSDKQLPLSLCL